MGTYDPGTTTARADVRAARNKAREAARSTGATHYVTVEHFDSGPNPVHRVVHWMDQLDSMRPARIVFVADGGEG